MMNRRGWAVATCLVLGASYAGGRILRADEEDEKKKGGPKEFSALKYRLVGPPAGGRVARATGVPGDRLTYYAATASGGVWKSTDGGIRWKPVFDDQPVSSIGAIALAPSDPSVVYVGTGEANIRGNVVQGQGIYKSSDAGKTWTRVWSQDGQIGTMVVHPRDPDVAYAAVLGKPFGPNPERGVYRTKDGGKTWQKVLYKDPDTGASDVAMDAQNPSVLFAGLWQARRRPWDLTSGGPGSGLYVSRDGGDTWTQIKKGLPEGIWGKVGVGVAPSDPRRVYALIEAEKGGLFRSDDGGETWTLASPHHALRQRAWYYSTLTIDPQNPDVVWFPEVPMLRTTDAGKTIKRVKGLHHGDHHDVWIDPGNPKRMITANDGGVDLTENGGETWYAPPLPISQFYHVAVDNQVPYNVFGAIQDMGTAAGPSNSLSDAGITLWDWHGIGGGEAGHAVADPDDPAVFYAGEYLGIITRYDHGTRQSRNVSAYPNNLSGHGAEDGKYRFQWTAPIALSPHDPKVVYHGGNVLFRTADGGQTWSVISPDLTRNDKSKQKWSGGPITGDNTGVEHYCTIFAIAESPREKGVIWSGSDDGLVQVTRDGGGHWTNVTPNIPRLPEWGTVSIIEPSPFDGGTAYVVVDAHRMDDRRPYLWKTTDYGKTWKSLTAGLPPDVGLHSVREDPRKRGLLFLGTERGVSLSADDGATWRELKLNLPTVPVHDLVVKGDDLVVGTHGRSIWILDDLTAIREWTAAVAEKPSHLFSIQPALRWRTAEPVTSLAKGPGENPPVGAVIQYALKTKPKADVTLEIVDQGGRIIRSLSSKKEEPDQPEDDPDRGDRDKPPTLSLDPGVQRAVWDLRYEGANWIRKARVDSGNPKKGPLALPGRYTAKLTVEGQTQEAPFEVRPDPRVRVMAAHLDEQLRFALTVRDELSRLTGVVNQIRSVRDQLRSAKERLAKDAKAASLLELGDDLIAKCDALEDRLHNPSAEVTYDILAMKGGTRLYSKLAPLYSWADEGDGRPTAAMLEMNAEHARELQQLEDEWKALVGKDLAAINEQAKSLAIPFIAP
jgi:photosystem II stability/assembly factor-like uncharacterized protein